jgi:hypothetical protein
MMAFLSKKLKNTAKKKFLKVLKLFKDDKIDLINRIELIEAQIEKLNILDTLQKKKSTQIYIH